MIEQHLPGLRPERHETWRRLRRLQGAVAVTPDAAPAPAPAPGDIALPVELPIVVTLVDHDL
ncbi:hypothetical protein [Curtobacterium herbarum]|uniref:Uncharacterized protein n=1 Tax=Curtobacterium herbarum TaxID=150122 RepID=A0ABN1ZDS2_9MICO|nr:hypothetical protein [Curtobacterium herbarum]MBM7476797.1 hypothetical protein [Curtobacterium herbarum]MCS6545189.1 hypothetical protein [Curtobacterium herbarum]